VTQMKATRAIPSMIKATLIGATVGFTDAFYNLVNQVAVSIRADEYAFNVFSEGANFILLTLIVLIIGAAWTGTYMVAMYDPLPDGVKSR